MDKTKSALGCCGSSSLLAGGSSLQKAASLSPASQVLSFNDPNLTAVVLKAPDNSQMKPITHPQKAKQC